MESFHIITLVVASVSLILILTIAGILLTKDKHSQKFPTSHSDVPDGWEKSEVDNGTVWTPPMMALTTRPTPQLKYSKPPAIGRILIYVLKRHGQTKLMYIGTE